jgi:excisionase family DNA binding protein
VEDKDTEMSEDSWLTLAEIAQELRMSPATIRSWISKGTLRAMRPGQRKLLVRRSELDRMLRGEDMDGPDVEPGAETWRAIDTINPPGRSPHWPAEAVEHVTRGGWLGVTETEWRNALRASALAPPDGGFVVRILQVAQAAARKAAALANLGDEEPGPWWQRQSGLPSGSLSYELRPGGSRPGPTALWARFDATVEQVGRAMEEHSVPAEQLALEQLSLVLHEIADALLANDVDPAPAGAEDERVDEQDVSGEPGDVDGGTDQSVS